MYRKIRTAEITPYIFAVAFLIIIISAITTQINARFDEASQEAARFYDRYIDEQGKRQRAENELIQEHTSSVYKPLEVTPSLEITPSATTSTSRPVVTTTTTTTTTLLPSAPTTSVPNTTIPVPEEPVGILCSILKLKCPI